ncbi:hypothetical protein NCCP1664_24100 [Zafaria cholistanensis]|uniref:Uncharacterized protein n=1 Tax=Zafaria cholistanensis TaxID=1682741 RepID=A0A5A7NSS6_9MICC|nr:hypothetical protein [Zafaria cholistanensis]GER23915.1 hypothetical protein NCCP1664_24100 [Zafaria cholistanensis]
MDALSREEQLSCEYRGFPLLWKLEGRLAELWWLNGTRRTVRIDQTHREHKVLWIVDLDLGLRELVFVDELAAVAESPLNPAPDGHGTIGATDAAEDPAS